MIATQVLPFCCVVSIGKDIKGFSLDPMNVTPKNQRQDTAGILQILREAVCGYFVGVTFVCVIKGI